MSNREGSTKQNSTERLRSSTQSPGELENVLSYNSGGFGINRFMNQPAECTSINIDNNTNNKNDKNTHILTNKSKFNHQNALKPLSSINVSEVKSNQILEKVDSKVVKRKNKSKMIEKKVPLSKLDVTSELDAKRRMDQIQGSSIQRPDSV